MPELVVEIMANFQTELTRQGEAIATQNESIMKLKETIMEQQNINAHVANEL
jgi:hypothetical protein